MGTCCSKTNPNFSSPTPKSDPPIEKCPDSYPKIDKTPEEKPLIKDKPITNPRKSKEIDRQSAEKIEKSCEKAISGDTDPVKDISIIKENSNLINNGNAIVRTSSCTRDEVEAILIQCGRLSRSSSAVQTPVRKYSGSKRSFDFDQDLENADVATVRQSRPSPNRRRTPGRERQDAEKEQNKPRSGSRERNNGGGGRRVSRSPGRRSESPIAATCQNPSGSGGGVSRPGKMVSVPATVASGDGPAAAKRVAGKKNAAASPRRSRSPAARANSKINNNNSDNQNQPLSRKGEMSPYRRNPLGEIDQNAQKQGPENVANSRTKIKELPQPQEIAKTPSPLTNNNIAVNVVPSGLTRTRSTRLSRDFDKLIIETKNPSPPSSYTALLLEDINNFHNIQNKTPISDSFPKCLSKACSILEEIADLNSNNGKKLLESKEPPLEETEVVRMNDLVEPSFQKYVTVKRGNVDEREEGEESSGSNSFLSGPQHWISSSLWETNSNDSNDCWASSSRSNTREDDRKQQRGIDCAKIGRGGQGRLVRSSPAVTAATI